MKAPSRDVEASSSIADPPPVGTNEQATSREEADQFIESLSEQIDPEFDKLLFRQLLPSANMTRHGDDGSSYGDRYGDGDSDGDGNIYTYAV